MTCLPRGARPLLAAAFLIAAATTGVAGADVGESEPPQVLAPGHLVVTKVSAADATLRLAGAVFALEALEGDVWVDTASTCTTADDGTCAFPDLAAGTRYRVVETAPPPGFALPDPPWYEIAVTTGETALLTVADPPLVSPPAPPPTDPPPPEPTTTSPSPRRNATTQPEGGPAGAPITVVKHGDGANVLAGATFELIGPSGLVLASCTTDADGTCELDNGNLNPDTIYRVHETAAPSGYSQIEAIEQPATPGNYRKAAVPGDTVRFANVRQNPVLPGSCGIDIVLLLDRSGSVGSSAPQYAAAANAFVNALVGTPSRIAVVSFSSSATLDSAFVDVAGGAGSLPGVINNVYGNIGGGTNWAAPFAAAPGADATIMITDGNPTEPTTPLGAVEAGVTAANAVKEAGTRSFVFGIGAGPNAVNLPLISSPDAVFTGSVETLQAQLVALAEDLCSGSIRVTKVSAVGNVPLAGAVFELQRLEDGAWVDIETPCTTGADGTCTFGDLSIFEQYRVVETSPPPGYALPADPDQEATVSLGETTDLTFVDTPNVATVTVRKLVDDEPGAGWTFDASGGAGDPAEVTPPEAITDGDGEATFTVTTVLAGGSPVTLTETLQAGFAIEDVACTDGKRPVQVSVDGTSATLTISDSQNIRCTFDNSTNTASVRVIKRVDGERAAGWAFQTATGSPTTVTPGSGQTDASGKLNLALSRVLNGGSAITLTETLQDGFTLESVTCVSGGAPLAASVQGTAATVTVFDSQSARCTFDNSSPPPPAPPPQPLPTVPDVPEDTPAVVEPPAEVPVATQTPRATRIQLSRSSFRRAFVPGQPVPLAGNVPADCRPTLNVDGNPAGPVETDDQGDFALDVDTSELTPGYHVARVTCAAGDVLESSFFVATPQASSSTLSVVLVALFALGALAWVGLRGLFTGATRP